MKLNKIQRHYTRKLFTFIIMWAFVLASFSAFQILDKFYASGSHFDWNSISPILKSKIIPSIAIMAAVEIFPPILIKILSKIFKDR